MELQLRDECRSLLTKLKVSQKCIKDTLTLSQTVDSQSCEDKNRSGEHITSNKFGNDITGRVNIAKDANTDLKPTYARNKLLSVCKYSTTDGKEAPSFTAAYSKEKENNLTPSTSGLENYRSSSSKLKHLHGAKIGPSPVESDLVSGSPALLSTAAASPSRIRKRQLINKHTAVQTKLNSQDLKELDDERLLNFNYSNINVDKNYGIKSVRDQSNPDTRDVFDGTKQASANSALAATSSEVFARQLQDQGNDRRYNNLVKEASIKPKSLLNSTDYYSLTKKGVQNNSRVHFSSTSNEEFPVGDQHLLGYDWIAALLDNDRNVIDQSESFFDEICDFRKAYKDECNNKFYKASPYTLVDREPEPVVEALTDPKVRPFIVNERLFTQPLNSDLIDDCDHGDKKSALKEPTKQNPRFVRVSIPRSSLQTPYRVKPHRRGSFDGSDSCSLVDHCLLGWENTVSNVIPPAKSLSLAADAGIQTTSQTTTLAEAERLATVHNQVQWHLSRPAARAQTLPRWRKEYMDMTLNMTLPSSNEQQSSVNASTLNQSSTGSCRRDVKRQTDRILQATYSTMYEMERLRQERELDKENIHA